MQIVKQLSLSNERLEVNPLVTHSLILPSFDAYQASGVDFLVLSLDNQILH